MEIKSTLPYLFSPYFGQNGQIKHNIIRRFYSRYSLIELITCYKRNIKYILLMQESPNIVFVFLFLPYGHYLFYFIFPLCITCDFWSGLVMLLADRLLYLHSLSSTMLTIHIIVFECSRMLLELVLLLRCLRVDCL